MMATAYNDEDSVRIALRNELILHEISNFLLLKTLASSQKSKNFEMFKFERTFVTTGNAQLLYLIVVDLKNWIKI